MQMRSIAVINVKKNVGSSKSNPKTISIEYKKHKATILSQIEIINPDIIINCSRVWPLFDDLSNSEIYWEGDVGFSFNSKRIIINAFHPQARWKQNEMKILTIYNKIISEKI